MQKESGDLFKALGWPALPTAVNIWLAGLASLYTNAAVYFYTDLLRIPTQNEAAYLCKKYILAARWEKEQVKYTSRQITIKVCVFILSISGSHSSSQLGWRDFSQSIRKLSVWERLWVKRGSEGGLTDGRQMADLKMERSLLFPVRFDRGLLCSEVTVALSGAL